MTWRELTLRDAEAMALAAEQAGAETHVAFAMTEDEFRLFYDRHARPLWAYLSRLTGDRHAADEIGRAHV